MGNIKRDKKDLAGEVWKECLNFTKYRASNLGRVCYPSGHKTFGSIHKIKGYRFSAPSKYQPWSKAVHLFVADAWLSPDSSRIFVNHKNRDRTDNRIENLERVTPSENTIHAWKTTKHCQTCSCEEK